MKVIDFINDITEKKVQDTTLKPNAVSEYLRETLEIKTYIPFRTKRIIVEEIVANNMEWVDGIKKYDNIDSYMSFVVAMLTMHTNLDFSSDPVADYDLLSESGLLPLIIEEFRTSYDECDSLFKMVLTSELEDNQVNAIFGRFLNNISQKIDGISEVLKGKLEDLDIEKVLGGTFNEEDLTTLKGFLDIYNK
jgi:hypothetical protein